jgi:hypothetical protein
MGNVRVAVSNTQGPKGEKWLLAQVPTVKTLCTAVFVAKASMR